MAILPRSDIIQPNDTVALAAKFVVDGAPVDLDTFPNVTVIQPGGGVAVGPTSMGVMHIGVGEYQFNYSVGLYPPVGTWRDAWQGVYQGFNMIGEYTFTTFNSQLPGLNTDGLKKFGDDPGYNFSQIAICNINNVLKSLRVRLKSKGKARRLDENGNAVYKDCDIYTVDELVAFVCQSLTMFNEIPHFTLFTWEDTPIIEQFHDVLTQGALYLALGAQALIERGREFNVQDNGFGFTPPTVSELLNTQYTAEMNAWNEKCKEIKHKQQGHLV
ncbi:hypothetical protein M0R72_02300 [Candidatus Pacearchaeota archaeon]|jgi:hypothetical protein|nr:hypothetical protein [Candidatus Pacearchaeota archaeon]